MFKISELIKITHGRQYGSVQDALVRGISIDSRTIRTGDLFIAIKGNRFDGHDFLKEAVRKKAAGVIVKEGLDKSVKVPVIVVKDTIRALADIAAYHRKKFNIPVVGVTGSNGKTTTKDMAAWILEKKFKVLKNPGTQNNQIGLPMTLLKLNKNFDIAVLEMGTNHFGEIGYLARVAKPNIGIINNIGPAHLEFLKNLAGVYREKYSLIKNLAFPSIAILNLDDRFLIRNIRDKDKFVIGFGINHNADYRASGIKRTKNGIEFLVNSRCAIKLKSVGVNNIYNALPAISVARLLGMDYNMIAERLEDFEFPAGRLTLIKKDKINFIDDTYNSNPASLGQALDALHNIKTKGRKIFIMGDMLELGRSKENIHRLAGRGIARVADVLITVGSLTRLAAVEANKAGLDINSIFNCDSCEEAKELLFNRIIPKKDDIILVKGSRLMQMEKIIR